MGHMEQNTNSQPPATSTLARLRILLLVLLAAEILGVAAELVLIGHWEDVWQWTPLVLLGVGLVVLAGHAICRNRASLRAVQWTMLLFLAGGVLGTWLHYDGRAEFRQEGDPSLGGWSLFGAAMTGSSTPPVLAPAVMIQMGCLGLLAVYRHSAGELPGTA
jgi:hypothetical protein